MKNLALMSYISVGSAAKSLYDLLEEWTMENLLEIPCSIIPQSTKVPSRWRHTGSLSAWVLICSERSRSLAGP